MHGPASAKGNKWSMTLRGLVVSGEVSGDVSAYSHRLKKLGECVSERSMECDYFYPEDHPPLNVWTTMSFVMPLWLRMLRRYDFIYSGCEEAGQSLFFCKPFLKGPILYDTHGDLVAQSALMRELSTGGQKKTTPARVRVVSRMSMAAAAQVLTVSSYHVRRLIEEGIPPSRISLIRNGVDLNLFAYQPLHQRPEFTFAYAGAYQSYQGVENLIDAFDRIRDPDVRLLLVGFTPPYATLKQQWAARLGSRVTLVDQTDRSTLVSLLSRAAILVIPGIDHPGRRNVFPTKFGEYAALGRPVLVTDVDETADFVRQYKCGFVSGCDAESMAAVMETAAHASHDSLVEMGVRARHMAEEHFSWERVGDEYAAVVRMAVERYRSENPLQRRSWRDIRKP
jgi:glycosyltransferase involved in cell wall biosynthesis